MSDQSAFWEIGDEEKREIMKRNAEAMCYQSLKMSLRLRKEKGGTAGDEKLVSLLNEVRQSEYKFIRSI